MPSRAEQRGRGASATGGEPLLVPKRPSISKDAGGKCLQTEMTRFVKRRWNSCRTCARRGRCRTNTAWILSTISETSPGHGTRIQVRGPCAPSSNLGGGCVTSRILTSLGAFWLIKHTFTTHTLIPLRPPGGLDDTKRDLIKFICPQWEGAFRVGCVMGILQTFGLILAYPSQHFYFVQVPCT